MKVGRYIGEQYVWLCQCGTYNTEEGPCTGTECLCSHCRESSEVDEVSEAEWSALKEDKS